MYYPTLKPILLGVVIGLLLFALPFILLKATLLFLFLGAFFSLARKLRGRWHSAGHSGPGFAGIGIWHPAFADTIRNMSEEEYGIFRQKLAADRPVGESHKTTIEIQ